MLNSGKADVNCYIGSWPFRRLGKQTISDLIEMHKSNGISTGLVSSLNSIFYNDPFEGEEELHEQIKGTGYSHIMTINPLLPCFLQDIEKGVKLFDIKGVRIYPSYHHYHLDNPLVEKLCEELRKLNLPLYIVVRMEDERLEYMFTQSQVEKPEISQFISKNNELKIVMLNMRMDEILDCKNEIINNKNVYFDTCGLKDGQLVIEQLIGVFGDTKIVYGSLFPLYCMKSSYFFVEKAKIDESSKNNIFFNNMKAIYGIK